MSLLDAIGDRCIEMEQTVYIVAAIFTIVAGIGVVVKAISTIVKNNKKIKGTLAEWTRRGIKVIYVLVSYSNNNETVSLNLYLCGEEKSWLFSDPSETNRSSHILAIKTVHYNPSYNAYNSYSDRGDIMAEWEAQSVRPLSEEPFPTLVQLVGKSKFRFGFYSDNDETIIISDSFKFKAELAECLRKYRIKYITKAPGPINRWKIENRYPT